MTGTAAFPRRETSHPRVFKPADSRASASDGRPLFCTPPAPSTAQLLDANKEAQSWHERHRLFPVGGFPVGVIGSVNLTRLLEQALQKMRPQPRQWCLRRVRVNFLPHLRHDSTSASAIQGFPCIFGFKQADSRASASDGRPQGPSRAGVFVSSSIGS